MGVGKHTERTGREDGDAAGGADQRLDGCRVTPRSASELDRDSPVVADQLGGGFVGVIVQRSHAVGLGAARQSRQIEARNPLGLHVDGKLDVEGSRREGVVDPGGATAQAIAQRIWIVEGEGFSHDAGEASEEVLLALWHLLHVVALAVRGLVAVDVPHADSIGGTGQGSGQGLEGAGPDRRHHGRGLTVVPAKRGRGVGHGHLVAALEGTHHPFLLIDAQHLTERGAAVPEDDQVLGDALSEQPQHESLRRVDVNDGGQGAGFEGVLDCVMGSNRTSPRLRHRCGHGHLLLGSLHQSREARNVISARPRR
jgi:hypothetical protein